MCGNTVPMAREVANVDEASAAPHDTSGAVNGDPKPRHRPPPSFHAKEVAQVVAFLIRNRGKVDTDPVRMKWDILDGFSLPLAVYLRDIEARAAWKELDAETLAVPAELCARPIQGMPRSLRHRKLLSLLPEWIARGELLLSSVEPDRAPDDPSPDLASDAPGGPDDPDARPWQP